MREHHPDQFRGLRAKYQEEGDQDLLRVIDERIREAEERCKLLNEAFEVLSDPLKRKQYDDQTVEPSVPLPEISIHPTKIAFGSLTEGQKKSLGFTVENKGGPPAAVNIDWEGNKPDWGELVIEPDEEKVFPIKVTVKVDTTGIPSGLKDEKILVDVDGRIYVVEVFLAVTRPVVAPATPTPTRTPTRAYSPLPSPTPPTKRNLTVPTILGVMVLVAIVIGNIDSANQQRQLERLRQQQSATQVALRNELSLVQVSNVRRMRGSDFDAPDYYYWIYIRFEVTNNSNTAIKLQNSGLFYPYTSQITPGQTVQFTIIDHTSRDAGNNKVKPRDGYDSISSQLCLNFWTVQEVENYESLDWHPSKPVGPLTVCKDVPSELASQ